MLDGQESFPAQREGGIATLEGEKLPLRIWLKSKENALGCAVYMKKFFPYLEFSGGKKLLFYLFKVISLRRNLYGISNRPGPPGPRTQGGNNPRSGGLERCRFTFALRCFLKSFFNKPSLQGIRDASSLPLRQHQIIPFYPTPPTCS